jgi:ABC-type sugar transport system ATPase subunit
VNTILQLEHITKSFPGVLALSDVNLSLYRGEVLGLVGENGAGKSTLMKILTGIYKKDSGTIRLDGKEVDIRSPLHAQQLGLSIIFQEFNLIKALSIAENIFTGRLSKKNRLSIDWKEVHSRPAVSDRRGTRYPLTRQGRESQRRPDANGGDREGLSFDSKIIFMDEPSATLTDNELINLFAIIGQLREQGKR